MFYCAAPCGREIEPVIYQTATTGYSVTYTPEEPGKIISHCFYYFKDSSFNMQ